jgi:hypothetical protein
MEIEKAYFWPLCFYQDLPKKQQNKIPKKLINKLQSANLYLWRALNIYDDLLDGAGQINKLPQANIYLRKFLEIYYRQKLPDDFYKLLNSVMLNLELANKKELDKKIETMNDLPALLELSDKSLALSLGPLAILAYIGEKTNGARFQATLNFFRCALAAKQLADDAQDWREDLNAGKITRANFIIKEKIKASYKKQLSPTEINLLFASYSAPQIINDLDQLIRLTKKELPSIKLRAPQQIYQIILDPIARGVKESGTFLRQLHQ